MSEGHWSATPAGVVAVLREEIEIRNDRIEELEVKLSEYKMVASAIDNQWADGEDENAELKAKLANVMRVLHCWGTMLDNPQYDLGEMADEFTTIVRTTLADLTGDKDE